jgi:DNA replicative helicase MCM subunit Mcm2 (Cdc46/Mcm family)
MDLEERWRGVYSDRRGDIGRLAEEYPAERSLSVDLLDLYDRDRGLAEALFADPDRVLRAGESALAALHDEFDRVNLRVENHPGLLAPGGVRSRHAGELAAVEGTVAETGPVGARIDRATYACPACDHELRRRPDGIADPDPSVCPGCGGHSFRRVDASFVDVQRLKVGTEGSEAGSIDAYLEDDLAGTAPAEQRVRLTGVVRLDRRAGNRFEFYLSALGVAVEPGESGDGGGDEIRELIQSHWEVI